MSTRAVVTFEDETGAYSVYKHCDGYPDGEHGIVAAIHAAGVYAWKLPRFEADEYAAAFVRYAKDEGGGDVRLTSGPEQHGDLAYKYTVTCANGKLSIKVLPEQAGNE